MVGLRCESFSVSVVVYLGGIFFWKSKVFFFYIFFFQIEIIFVAGSWRAGIRVSLRVETRAHGISLTPRDARTSWTSWGDGPGRASLVLILAIETGAPGLVGGGYIRGPPRAQARVIDVHEVGRYSTFTCADGSGRRF
jgi:hypothetical protein